MNPDGVVVPDGIVVVNKPEGWTSHDVVSKMRGIFGTRRAGHLGVFRGGHGNVSGHAGSA